MDHFSICCKSLVNKVPLKGSKGMESLGPHTANGTSDWLLRNGQEVMHYSPYSTDTTPNNLCLFGHHKKYLANKRFANDTDTQQALIFVVPCIMLNSEIIPTRCNNCVYSSQWFYSFYMFRVTIPPIIRSTMLYMASQVGRYTVS